MNYYSVANILCNVNQYEKAYGLFEKGSSAGDVKCKFGLALLYNNGYFVEKNENKAIEIMTEINDDIFALANDDDREAMCILAHCFGYGFFTSQDEELSEEWYKKARQPLSFNDTKIDDYFIISRNIYESNEEGVETDFSVNDLFEIAMLGCMIGDTRCLFYLSICYKNGIGTDVNESEADSINSYLFSECERLAENGDKFAMYLLYLIYLKGIGVFSNLKKSKNWLIKSACFGDDMAKYKIANHILNEEDSLFDQFDRDEAIEWLNSSARLGNSLAIEKLKTLDQDVFYYSKLNFSNPELFEDENYKSTENQSYDIKTISKNYNKYLNNLIDVNDAITWVDIYKECKKGGVNRLSDCDLYSNRIFDFHKNSIYTKSIIGEEICKYFEDYIKLNDCLIGINQLLDELYFSCQNRIDYEKKAHFFGLIKVTDEVYTIKLQESSGFANLKQHFLNNLENNVFDEAIKLCSFLKSISADIKNLGSEQNLQIMLELASGYGKGNYLTKIFYTAQFVNKYGNVVSDSEDMWIDPELSRKMSKKYPYFSAVLGNCSKIYASDIGNLKY